MNALHEIINIADIHADRIKMALDELRLIFPLDQSKVVNLNQQELLLIELLASRFAKLQDFLGRKMINEVLGLTGDLIESSTMLDKINQLERMEIIESTELWKDMREARNHISHEYPDKPELTAKYLNQIFDLAPKLLDFFCELKKRVLQLTTQ